MSDSKEGPNGRGRRGMLVAAGLAMILAAIGFGWFTFRNGPSAHPTPAAVIQAASGRLEVLIGKGYWRQAQIGEELPKGILLRTDEGANASLRLTGGTQVRIDPESRVLFITADVLRLEHGAIDLETGSAAPGRPALEVRTPFGSIQTPSARFEVRWFDSAFPSLLLRVREGSITFHGESRSELVAAGEEFSMQHDGRVTRSQIQ